MQNLDTLKERIMEVMGDEGNVVVGEIVRLEKELELINSQYDRLENRSRRLRMHRRHRAAMAIVVILSAFFAVGR